MLGPSAKFSDFSRNSSGKSFQVLRCHFHGVFSSCGENKSDREGTASVANMSEIVHKQIDSVGFGFYHPDEIKKLSVKKISVPFVFDNLNRPVPNGLYDPAMGPMDKYEE